MTRLQRLQLLKWILYSALCVLLLLIQDVLMSRLHLYGSTTDLVAAILLLIGIHEGAETGGLFALIASSVYWFSGSAPGPYVIPLITFLVIGTALFRQIFWRRSFGSTALCVGMSILLYEIILFLIGILLGRTIWARAGIFCLTGVYSIAVILPLYPAVSAIGKIGGDTWKE